MNKLFRKSLDFKDWVSRLGFYKRPERQFVPVSFPRLAKQVVYDKRNGSLLKLEIRRKTSDWPVFEQIFLQEDYRLTGLRQAGTLMQAYRRILESGATPLILDCGANIGLSCVWFARTYPEAIIIGVEPEPRNFSMAQHNTHAFPNIKLVQAAVAAKDGTVQIVDPGHGTSGFQTVASINEGHEIPAYSIDSLVNLTEENGARKVAPFLVKIDIEGFEGPLFAENIDWIDSVPLIIVELHDWLIPCGGTSANFLQAVSCRKRDFVFREENVFSIKCGIA